MKKILPVLSLLFGILACNTQPRPAQDVGNIVNATLTAIAQSNSQNAESQPTFTSSSIQEPPTSTQVESPRLHYYWPTTLPEGFVLSRQTSSAADNGYNLNFINPSVGTIDIFGGEYAGRYPICPTDSIPQMVRGFDGCFPQSTGGGFGIQWKEANFPYSVSGFGLSRELALQIAEQLESLDFNIWIEHLKQ